MNQILESTYLENRKYWEAVARDEGGLEICSNYNGQPIYTIGTRHDVWY